MWQQHLVVVGILVVLALPVYLLDYFLLRPSGDIFLINVRHMLVAAYGAWLTVHVPVSTLAMQLLKTDRIYALHAVVAVVSVALLLGGLRLHDRIHFAQVRAEREARMKMRQGLFDAITLQKWWYVPGTGKPEAIGAVFLVAHAGRLAASVEGRGAGTNSVTLYAGKMDPQKKVRAGERIEYAFPLKYYGEGKAGDLRFTFYLFRNGHGSAPEDIFKTYAAVPERTDDGEYFHDVLPPAASGAL